MYSYNQISFYNVLKQGTTEWLPDSGLNVEPFHNEVITDINLYYQPTRQPVVAIIFFILKCIIIIVGEYIHMHILDFLKLEGGLVSDILKMFLRVQMVYWPVTVLFGTTTDFFHPLQDIIGEWYCKFGYFWIVGGMTLIVFHSFIVGLMRYIFVVHNERVVSYGKEKAKKMFFLASILIPVFVTLWGHLNGRDPSAITSLNKCYGVHHKVFLIENRGDSTMRRNFCLFEDDDEEPGQFLTTLRKTSCTLRSALYAIMGFNVVEGLLYWRTVVHANKYVYINKRK